MPIIPDQPSDDRAHYDDNGNIHIHGQPEGATSPTPSLRKKQPLWEVTEEDELVKETRKTANIIDQRDKLVGVLKNVRGTVLHTTSSVFEEGKQQYSASYVDLKQHSRYSLAALKQSSKNLWTFLTQPVWLMRKNKAPKQYSRGALFALDVIRFGGTFAAIFVALFVSLNYESFWQIVSPHFDPIDHAQALNAQVSEVDNTLKEKLLKSPMLATAGKEEGSLLSYLPSVGPPENRIIVPKLNLNVPLVTPSFSSLLQEDWEGVERDIQDALKYGVVHYPGTARPGQAGNFFVTGHSSYYPWADGNYKTVFARLHELEVGDEYWVYYGGDKHRYIIDSKKEVKPSNVTVLDQPTSRRMATLMTCTPVGTTLRRLIITAQEVDPTTGMPLQVGEREQREQHDFVPEALPI